MIKLPPFDLYAGNTADRNNTNFPKRGNALAYIDTEADTFYVHVGGAWHGLGVPGIPEPDDDGVPYARKTDGTSSWVAVVPKAGGQFTGNVGFGITPTVPLHVSGESIFYLGGRTLHLHNPDGFYHTMDFELSGNYASSRIRTSNFVIQVGTSSASTIAQFLYSTNPQIGFFGATPVVQQNAVKATTALQNLGLGTSLIDYVAATGGTFSGAVTISSGGLSVTGGGTINGGVVFNEPGASVNHRFESSGNTHMLFVDAGNNRVAIGHDSPDSELHVNGAIRSSSDTFAAFVTRAHLNNTSGGVFLADKTRGTKASPSNVQNGDFLFQFLARGYHSSGYRDSAAIELKVSSSGTLSSTSMPGRIDFKTSPNGSVTLSTRMALENGLVVGSPTGGDKGAGTINATAVYDDNTLLTDWVFDLYYDGKMSVEDAKRYPKARLWNIEETAVFTKKNHHLPTMPGRKEWERGSKSVGELVTRLWETVEQQQLQIFELNDQLKAVING